MVTHLVFKATILIVAELCSPAISVSNAGARREKPLRHDGEQQLRFKVLCPDSAARTKVGWRDLVKVDCLTLHLGNIC